MPGDVSCFGLWPTVLAMLLPGAPGSAQPTQASLVGLHHQAQPDPMGTPQKKQMGQERRSRTTV